MDWKVILSSFGLLFVAELGDKTQLATLALATKTGKPLSVFIGSAVALVLITGLAVLVGGLLNKHIPKDYVHYGAAILFIVVGIVMLIWK